MQNLLHPHHSKQVQGQESLYFDQAQILKFKGDRIAFASSGPLSIIYFKEYDRFVLKLNDWKFPLIKRLPILSMDANKNGPKTYILPASNGFLYKLTIEESTPQALLNLESIIKSNSCFAIKGEEAPFRKIEDSPDDKLTRQLSKDTGPIEIIGETLKTGVEKFKIAGKTLTSGTLGITSRKQKLDLKSLRNKNFKKKAKSSFKQDFFIQGRSETQDLMNKRKNNLNRIQTQPMYHLKRGPNLPNISIFREDLENCILNNKALASLGHFNLGKTIPLTFSFSNVGQKTPPRERETHHEAKGFFDALKHGLLEIKDTFSGLLLGAGNDNYETERVEIGNLEPEVEPEPQMPPEETQEKLPRKKSFAERIKSGVNEFLQDMSMAINDRSSNLDVSENEREKDKDKEKLSESREPILGQTDPSILYGMRNWEGLTHYQG